MPCAPQLGQVAAASPVLLLCAEKLHEYAGLAASKFVQRIAPRRQMNQQRPLLDVIPENRHRPDGTQAALQGLRPGRGDTAWDAAVALVLQLAAQGAFDRTGSLERVLDVDHTLTGAQRGGRQAWHLGEVLVVPEIDGIAQRGLPGRVRPDQDREPARQRKLEWPFDGTTQPMNPQPTQVHGRLPFLRRLSGHASQIAY